MRLALMTCTLLLALPAVAAEVDVASDSQTLEIADTAAFADAVEQCQASTHVSPHPFVKGFIIEHAITGEHDGTCAYSQTMPGGMRMECALSEAGRAGLASEFREQAQGRMSGGTGRQPAWTAECDIVTKDGQRSPMAKG